MRPLLVFGANGQLGRQLMATAVARQIDVIGPTRAQVDICDAGAVAAAVAQARPSIIVNTAAYTAVDKAEREPALAAAVNTEAAGSIAAAAARHDVPILHLSTDYVFDGLKGGAYDEDDPIAPLSVYGQTKADGEARVRGASKKHVIIRTAWIFGSHGSNFLKTMLRLASSLDRLRVVADQIGSPTATLDLAHALLDVCGKLETEADRFGTFHFAGDGPISWHRFAEEIIAAQAPYTGKHPPVDAIATADYPTAARRPSNSSLDSSRFRHAFGYRPQARIRRIDEVVQALLTHERQAPIAID